ncbi:TatD DNase domain containing [Seminavis robusta]|uniref:TatD DNase domain containing n=1 Tax=Seminavis robusta TaxID=568900 RepID=A0A9N8DPZ6_9STRA|nr:TatD DNase domain containing [Seminavis robusta]|eukprot:Sro288_g108840.1 TatD DNase domain containing (425) ;mRNA; f:50975-52249
MVSTTTNVSCPCCVFLKDDLFLPPLVAKKGEELQAEEGSTIETGVGVPSPTEALKCIQDYAQQVQEQKGLTPQSPAILLVDTHNHAHLRRERHDAYVMPTGKSQSSSAVFVVSLTLAVEPADWEDALQYAATCSTSSSSVTEDSEQSTPLQMADRTLMGLGIHPWYLSEQVQASDNDWRQRLETLIQEHPSCVVGEIGLCKMAKCARSHPEGKARGFEFQREVLQEQLTLATKYRRPVSIHCVQQHGVFLDMLKEITMQAKAEPEKPPSSFVPPTMAMHSFTGTAHHVKALLQWEATLFGEGPNDSKKKKKKKTNNQQQKDEENHAINNQPRPPLLYFGFSHIVNYDMCTSDKARRQGREAIRAVPLDRLLAESDVHHPQDVPAGTAGAIAYLASALELPIPQVAEITARNGLDFLQSHLGRPN